MHGLRSRILTTRVRVRRPNTHMVSSKEAKVEQATKSRSWKVALCSLCYARSADSDWGCDASKARLPRSITSECRRSSIFMHTCSNTYPYTAWQSQPIDSLSKPFIFLSCHLLFLFLFLFLLQRSVFSVQCSFLHDYHYLPALISCMRDVQLQTFHPHRRKLIFFRIEIAFSSSCPR